MTAPGRVRRRKSRIGVAALLLPLLLTACGARFDRSDTLGAAAGAETGGAAPTAIDGGIPAAGGAPLANESRRPIASPGAAVVGPRAPGSLRPTDTVTGGSTASGGANREASGHVPAGSTTGVTDTTVKLALFAPLTGAAPVPASAAAQAQSYWDTVNASGGIHGRTVSVKVFDTQSTEAGARAAVKQMQDKGYFAAYSIDRGAIEAALVHELEKAQIPHLPTLVPERLALGPNTFHIGTDQAASTRQVAQYMAKVLKLKRVGIVSETSPVDYPAADAWRKEARRLGLQIVHDEQINGQDSQFLAEAQKLAHDKADAVLLFVAPTPAINIASSARQNGYQPIWMGNSVFWNFNLVLSGGAGAFDRAIAFSPWGGLSDPRYAFFNQKNTKNQMGSRDKDIGLNTWGMAQPVAAAMLAAGRDLGRNSFRAAMQNLSLTSDPVTKSPLIYGPMDFRGGRRHGSGDLTVVLKVAGSGATSQWATASGYRSRYDQ